MARAGRQGWGQLLEVPPAATSSGGRATMMAASAPAMDTAAAENSRLCRMVTSSQGLLPDVGRRVSWAHAATMVAARMPRIRTTLVG